MATSDPIATRIIRRRRIAEDTQELALALAQPLEFQPGQYIAITLPNLPVAPPYRVREFSMVSAPGDPELTIAFRESDTAYKQAILDPAYTGPIITRGPTGLFTLPSQITQPLIFIAGGIGVAPFISMLKQLVRQPTTMPITLLRIESSLSRTAYRPELQGLERALPNLNIVEHFGRIATSSQLSGLIPTLTPESQVFIAGPLGMTGHTRTLVREFGVMPLSIHMEEFTGYPDLD
ncbi:MAG TPA: FAD-dependent oxidoreductase [Candidatus Saccharimonadia bacterium]|jgi:ferredoxin-NADP reductase